MTVEMFVVVIVLLVVKYTLEFADRTRPPRVGRALKRLFARRPPAGLDIEFARQPAPRTPSDSVTSSSG